MWYKWLSLLPTEQWKALEWELYAFWMRDVRYNDLSVKTKLFVAQSLAFMK